MATDNSLNLLLINMWTNVDNPARHHLWFFLNILFTRLPFG